MRLSAILLGVLFALPAGADEIVEKGVAPHANARILSADERWITFEAGGKTIFLKVADAVSIRLEGFAEFNAAEAALKSGDFAKAVRLYDDAAKAAKADWQKPLIAGRRALAVEGTQHPGSRPANAPAAGALPTAVRGATTAPAGGPLASPEALCVALAKAPPNPENDAATWQRLTTLQKDNARAAYAKALERWEAESNWRGAAVTWPLCVVDIRPMPARPVPRYAELEMLCRPRFLIRAEEDAPSGGGRTSRVGKAPDDANGPAGAKRYIGKFASQSGCPVTVVFPESLGEALAKLNRYDEAVVRGTVLQYARLSERIRPGAPPRGPLPPEFGILLEGNDVQRRDAPRVGFAGLASSATAVAFVVDRSGSMLDKFDAVKNEVHSSLNRLGARQRFQVAFFSDKAPFVHPSKGMAEATPENKKAADEFLKPLFAKGTTDPVSALEAAFGALGTAKDKEKVLYLLTDGEFPNPPKVLDALRARNAGKAVRVNTVLFGAAGREAEETMRKIAQDYGGQFRHVWSAEDE